MELTYDFGQLSPKEYASQICSRLRETFGVDLEAIYTSQGLSDRQKLSRARSALLESILTRAYNEALPDFLAGAPIDSDPNLAAFIDEDIDIEPNIALSENDAVYLIALQGDEVKTYLFNLTKRFENMAESKTVGTLIAEMVGGGIISVGVPAAVATVKALKAGETLLAAMKTGITSLGMKTVIAAVVVVLAALLLYLFLENPKKILGMVINNTSENFVVNGWESDNGDLFMQHGHMVDFMQDNEDGLQSPKVQLKGKLDFGPGDEDNVVFAGIYFADRNFGLRGSEGIMVFTSKTSSLKFAHMFAVPYVNDNGANMKYISGSPGNLETLYRELYDTRKVRVAFVSNSYSFTATVNDARGGVVGCIASITGPV